MAQSKRHEPVKSETDHQGELSFTDFLREAAKGYRISTITNWMKSGELSGASYAVLQEEILKRKDGAKKN